MLNKLIQAGITFLPEIDNEALIDIEHRKAINAHWKTLQYSQECADSCAETIGQTTEAQVPEEYDKMIERAREVHGKAYNDPVYASKKALADKAKGEWSNALEFKYSHLPFAESLGDKMMKEASKKEQLASIPDDALLSSAVNKYATGWEAELAKLMDYMYFRNVIRDNAENADLLRSQPQVLAGIKRLELVEAQAKKRCYDKCYEDNFRVHQKLKEEYTAEVKKHEKMLQDFVREDAAVIIPLVTKLMNNPKATEGVTNSMYQAIRKRCDLLEEKKENAMVDCVFVFRVWSDHIDYRYKDDYFGEPDLVFKFEENNYRVLENDVQATALALVAGQMLSYRLHADPAFELANINATYGVQRVAFTISYPNPKHVQTISFF